MSEFKISARAYSKIILHAAKYPHCAVNGVLLADKESAGRSKNVHIVDVIPLFHQCLYVTPMAEIALMQVICWEIWMKVVSLIVVHPIGFQIDAMAQENDLAIAGYYAAPENFYHCTIDKTPGIRIADKIAENCSNACLLLVCMLLRAHYSM